MTQYTLHAGKWNAATLPQAVGNLYNVGLSDGTNYYGYCFQNNGQQSTGMVEKSDVATKSALQNYGSPNLVDRDLVYYPRVSQGDFSGGGLQIVALDLTKYYDSDLEIRTPGYVNLRSQWTRQTLTASTGTYQCVVYGTTVYTAWGVANIYNDTGGTITPGVNAKLLDTDGNLLYAADGVNTLTSYNGSGWFVVSNAIGTIKQMWVINQGTNGFFCYYTLDGITLKKVDLSNDTINIAVPTGGNQFLIDDIAPYNNGIAIATHDQGGGGSCDIWFHDGTNMTRLVHLYQYRVIGLCNSLGNLYATAVSSSTYEPPMLVRVSSGSYTVVARPGLPFSTVASPSIGAPIASGQYVYFTLGSPQITNISTVSYIGVYDTESGAFSHLPNLDASDAPQVAQPRQLAAKGRFVYAPMTIGGNAVLQKQNAANFQTSGWLVSSKLDFSTPGISKRFRRIEVHHSPLATGEQIKVNAYVDLDPTAFTTGLAPSPASATVTNSTLNSTTTTLTFGADTVGKTLYYAIQLTAGASNATTPKVIYTAVEVGGTWTWEFDLDCSSKRRLLNGSSEDQQGINGKDLYFLIRNAYENGTTLTQYLAESASYSVAIESVEAKTPAYVNHQNSTVLADQEWLVHVVLRQVN